MTDYINIFVEADISLQQLVTVVENILDIKKQRFLDEHVDEFTPEGPH